MKDQILSHLPGDFPWQNQIVWFDSIDSTNSRTKAMAQEGAPHGTILIADHQTLGKGRMGRSFHSPAGMGIYMSVLLRPDCAPIQLMHLTCAAAVAMCDAVEKTAGIRPGIKWTNDLVCGKRKLAGILTELGVNSHGRVSHAIIGIGINCCQAELDFPEDIRSFAGSLAGITGRKIDRARVAAAMVEALWQMDRKLLTDKAHILDQYRADCITLGREIALMRGNEARYGKAMDIDDEGALVVRFSDGRTEAVSSGEVSIRGMYGYL